MQKHRQLLNRVIGAHLLGCGLFLLGCAEDLAADAADTGETAHVVTSNTPAGEFTTSIDASNAEAWVYLSLQSGAEVTPIEPASSEEWDLAFQRFLIISNGGVSGSGTTSVATLTGETFENVSAAPAGEYLADQADSDDDDAVADSAFAAGDDWYEYDSSTNRLSPRPIVYVIRTSAGSHYKLALLNYYDEAGTSGHPSFIWAEIPAP